MRYISVFSGIAGLEHSSIKPLIVCEKDEKCRLVLSRRLDGVPVHDDVLTLRPPKADVVVGGWPCQDITSAGKMAGITGARSGLFFRMVELARESHAHTIIGENVPNLLHVNEGGDFSVVVNTLRENGYTYVSWRTLDAREFGLPQSRRRVFIVASRDADVAQSIHCAPLPVSPGTVLDNPHAAGFYWTAGGKRSICYSRGFIPALKVGASDNKGRSAVAVFVRGKVRKLSARECLALQGFDAQEFNGLSKTDSVRMAGNAVPAPVGRFVVDTVMAPKRSRSRGELLMRPFVPRSPHGWFDGQQFWSIAHQDGHLANNLEYFLERSGEPLSSQAAAGLLYRSAHAQKDLPIELFDALLALSRDRSGKLRASRANSFEKLDAQVDLVAYRTYIGGRDRRLHRPWPLSGYGGGGRACGEQGAGDRGPLTRP